MIRLNKIDGKLEKSKAINKKVTNETNDLIIDGTSHVDISLMDNIEYSGQIIKKTRKNFNFRKIQKLGKRIKKTRNDYNTKKIQRLGKRIKK